MLNSNSELFGVTKMYLLFWCWCCTLEFFLLFDLLFTLNFIRLFFLICLGNKLVHQFICFVFIFLLGQKLSKMANIFGFFARWRRFVLFLAVLFFDYAQLWLRRILFARLDSVWLLLLLLVATIFFINCIHFWLGDWVFNGLTILENF